MSDPRDNLSADESDSLADPVPADDQLALNSAFSKLALEKIAKSVAHHIQSTTNNGTTPAPLRHSTDDDIREACKKVFALLGHDEPRLRSFFHQESDQSGNASGSTNNAGAPETNAMGQAAADEATSSSDSPGSEGSSTDSVDPSVEVKFTVYQSHLESYKRGIRSILELFPEVWNCPDDEVPTRCLLSKLALFVAGLAANFGIKSNAFSDELIDSISEWEAGVGREAAIQLAQGATESVRASGVGESDGGTAATLTNKSTLLRTQQRARG